MTKVIFRKKWWGLTEGWEVMAFFPQATVNPGNVMCYAHVGQHSEASYDFYRTTKACTQKEYQALKDELEECCGYDDLKVVQRITRHDQERAWWPERFKEEDLV